MHTFDHLGSACPSSFAMLNVCVKKAGGNLLELFYNDPKRWSYTFQSYALLSRMRLQREPFGADCQARLSERSIHSDR